MSEGLLDYNKRGALASLLAIEEHLQQLPADVDRSWCVKKHSLVCTDHHLTEAINHASRVDPQKAALCRKLKAAAEKVLRPGDPMHLPRLQDVAALRNELRRAFNDPTLGYGATVCAKDGTLSGLSGSSWGTWAFIALGLWAIWPRR